MTYQNGRDHLLLRSLLPTAYPDQRTGLLSAFCVQCYLAFSLPAIAAGLAVPEIGLSTTAYIYGAAVIPVGPRFDDRLVVRQRQRAGADGGGHEAKALLNS